MGAAKETAPPESVRLLVVEALARLAPLTLNEGAPVSVAVMLPGSFSVPVIATGAEALTVPEPAETSAVPIVIPALKFVCAGTLGESAERGTGRVVRAPVHQRRGNVVAAPGGGAAGDGQAGHEAGVVQRHRAAGDGRGTHRCRRGDRGEAAAGVERRHAAGIDVDYGMPETAALFTAAPPTVAMPPLAFSAATLPPPKFATPPVIAAVPTLPPLWLSVPPPIAAVAMLPLFRLSRPPPLLIVAAPTLVAALPK